MINAALRVREGQILERIRRWLKRYWPWFPNDPIIVRFWNMKNPNLQGFHWWNGKEHHIVLNLAFADSPLLDAIVAHEVGHLVDVYRRPRIRTRLRAFIRGTVARQPDKLDTWWDILTGVHFSQELFADACAIRILKEEKIGEHKLLEIIQLPYAYQHGYASRIVNNLTRWAAIVHYHIRTRQ